MYGYTCVYNFISMNIKNEKEIWFPNKEYIGCHECERTDMSTKCKIFMNSI